MKKLKAPQRLLWYEGLGFAMLVVLSWLNELAGLPYLLFGGGPPHTNWRESVMETLMVLLVAVPVLVLTKRLAARLVYLEGYLWICAWCKKVLYEGEWITWEEYVAKGLNTKTSHGMCRACAEGMVRRRS